jgi:uncharacterized membrane protein
VADEPEYERLVSIDVLRGLVMVLMALDHVRVYSGLPAGGPTAGIFFTRWVTHFCAPAFVFFAGTSAFLSGRRRGTSNLAQHLATRGLALVLLELTVLRLAWTFNFDYAHYILLGVIWMLGVCMILMAGLVFLSTRTIAIIGLLIVVAQDVLTFLPQDAIGQIVYFGGVFEAGQDGPAIAVLYSIVPWIGVMAAGYAFGAIMIRDSETRRRWCLRIGLSATVLFLVIGGALVLTQTPPRNAPPLLLRLLNQRKYPASQLFLLMTLGPTIALMPLADRARGAIGGILATFGRVPLFYYLLHIPLIHAIALIVSLIREGRVNPWLFGNHPMMPPPVPADYMWSLPLLYLVFAIVIAILYWPCSRYARIRAVGRTIAGDGFRTQPRAWP